MVKQGLVTGFTTAYPKVKQGQILATSFFCRAHRSFCMWNLACIMPRSFGCRKWRIYYWVRPWGMYIPTARCRGASCCTDGCYRVLACKSKAFFVLISSVRPSAFANHQWSVEFELISLASSTKHVHFLSPPV